jgi:hypothetical protein
MANKMTILVTNTTNEPKPFVLFAWDLNLMAGGFGNPKGIKISVDGKDDDYYFSFLKEASCRGKELIVNNAYGYICPTGKLAAYEELKVIPKSAEFVLLYEENDYSGVIRGHSFNLVSLRSDFRRRANDFIDFKIAGNSCIKSCDIFPVPAKHTVVLELIYEEKKYPARFPGIRQNGQSNRQLAKGWASQGWNGN